MSRTVGYLSALALAAVTVVTRGGAEGSPADAEDTAGRVLAALNRARAQATAPLLARRAELDSLASDRARRVAAQPHLERLRASGPLADDLRQAGVVRYHQVATHVEMVRGYERPEEGLVASWRAVASAWDKAIAAEYDAVGAATWRTEDGWIVFVAVLLDELPALPEPAALEQAVLLAVNRERSALRLAVLTPSSALAAVARAHSQDMADRGYLSHVDPEGRGPADRVARAGIRYARLAENIHWSQNDPGDAAEVAVRAWLASPGHRRAMLDPDVRESGVGAVVGANGSIHLTQLFLGSGLESPGPPIAGK